MDFLKTLLVYLTVTMATGVQQGPPLENVPIPTPTPYVATQQENVSGLQVDLPETPEPPTATPNPNPTITPNRSYKNVAYGDSGSNVRKLQRKLIELGYLPAKSDDGKFGYQTLNAVRAFQEKNGLKKDGVAGAATLTHLYQNPDVVPAVTATPAPTDTPAPTVAPSEAPAEVAEISVPEPIAPPEQDADAEAVPDVDADPEDADAEDTDAADEPAALPAMITEPAADDREPVAGPIEGLTQVMDGTIALGESGAPLAALRLTDGVMQPFYPRVWKNGAGEAVVSLRDMADTIGGWTLEIDEDDENRCTLTAAGYVIVFNVTDDGVGCTVDGEDMPFEAADLQSDGSDLYVTENFLRQALKASVLWDDDEHTLMLTVPEKAAAQAND